jgi:hypothetical protein
MSVMRRWLNRLDFVCQMQGSWVSIKGADVPAAAEDQSLLYAPTHNQK